ncbi:hypothetical protein OPX35_06130, partial [Staphylococcus epidermidis]|uniref:hypothetical protein n=1 Tax=Staphylococcus epidermidis TaxID=1282 RepID=UPI00223FB52D
QRAENNQKIYKKDNFYIISIEIVFFSLIQELYVPDSFYVYLFSARLNSFKHPTFTSLHYWITFQNKLL